MSTIKVTFKSWFVNVIRAIFSFKHVEKSSEESDELDDTYFIDAKSNSFNTVNFYPNVVIDSDDSNDNDSEQIKAVKQEPEIIKVPVKPRDVLIELERVPTQWSLNGLDEKITLLKNKMKLIHKNFQAKRDVSLLLFMLQNRKKYYDKAQDGQVFWQYFAKYDVTNEEKINMLLTKHSLVMDKADMFIPEFPADAIFVMTEFLEKCKEMCGKEPRFYVIATKESFKKTYEKRDPILLAQSPFGFYYHILAPGMKK